MNCRKLFLLLLALILSACDKTPLNDPHPYSQYEKNIRYSSFAAPPKTLDPARAYSSDEMVFIAQVYEPPLQYHYLKRPYTLIPLTSVAMPKITYVDQQGKIVASSTPPSQVAYSIYDIEIKPGIYYQPHPAFAKNEAGDYYYHRLNYQDTKNINQLNEFKHLGTRELVADDYVYEIKRLAHPRVNSPILGVMENYILGLKEFSQQLQKNDVSDTSGFLDLRQYPLKGVQTISRYHYRIFIKGKYPQFIYWLAMPFFSPIPWEADLFYSQPGMQENNLSFDWYPIGTGAYLLAENNPNRQMVLKRNPHFHGETFPSEGEPGDKKAGYLDDAGKPLPFVDTAIYSLEKEYMPRWNKFLQGYYDLSTVSSDSFDQAIQVDPSGKPVLTPKLQKMRVNLQSSVSPSINYLGFNMLDDVVGGQSERARKLRLAIAIAIDYEEYINIFLNGRGVVAQGPIPPGIFGFLTGKPGINPYVYDWKNNRPERKSILVARELLARAGYPGGVDKKTGEPLVLNYDAPITGGPDEKAFFNWMRKQFAKLGIQLNIRGTEYNRFQQKMLTGQAQIFSWGWSADYPDPENFLFLLYGPNSKVHFGGENAANYSNEEFDSLFNEMKSMPNGPERQKIINKMLAIVRHDSPWVFGVHTKDFILSHVWNKLNKPNEMVNNALKYQRLDPILRAKLQQEWNKPIFWPLGVGILIILMMALPVVIIYWRKEIKDTVKKRVL